MIIRSVVQKVQRFHLAGRSEKKKQGYKKGFFECRKIEGLPIIVTIQEDNKVGRGRKLNPDGQENCNKSVQQREEKGGYRGMGRSLFDQPYIWDAGPSHSLANESRRT